MMPLWRRILIKLQQLAEENPSDCADFAEAYLTILLLHYEEIYR